MNDEKFLHSARRYVTDDEISAAYAMTQDPALTVEYVCCDYGCVSHLTVMALQGKLKEAVTRNGKIAPGRRYVDPWREAACIDYSNVFQLAAFAIYRTVERRPGVPQLAERGSRVN